jgi:hypothetical protein
MRRTIFILSFVLLTAGTASAQQKKTTKPKSKSKTTNVKKASAPPAEEKDPVCYPLKEIKDYYKIDIRDKQFKTDFEEIFELSPYDYSGYSLKTIIENTIRGKLGESAANTLDMFAGSGYVEIGFTNNSYRSQIVSELCGLFADHEEFEKYLKKLKKATKAEEGQWRM